MALRFFIIVLLIVVVGMGVQLTHQINQTDLETAVGDMREKSYHGFVILVKMLNASSNPLKSTDVTFLMPNDEKLSEVVVSPDHLLEFILSHSIPTALLYNNLLHFPNGTLVPSTLPGRMLSITNTAKAGLYVNNARIVNSNVCINSQIKCHGISSSMTFDARAKSSPSIIMKRNHLH